MGDVEPGAESGIATPRLWILFALLLVPLYLWAGLGNRDVWAPDEPRFALVAREMQQRGNYVLPTVNGEIYAHKPPVLFWSISIASLATGKDASDGFTARLPSALAGVGSLVATAVIGDRLFGRRVALLAPLVLATSHLFCWESHAAQMDALLTFWVTLAMMFLVLHRESGRRRYALGFQLACSMGLLTKGVGVVFPWALAWLWKPAPEDKGKARELFRALPLLVFALPALTWISAAAYYGGQDYIGALLGKNVMKRYFDSWHHHKPFYYFLTVTPVEIFPWTGLIPAMLVFVRGAWRDERVGRGVRFAAIWFLVMLVFFSFPKGKRNLYMLPSFPAIALLAAATLDAAAQGAERLRKLSLPGMAAVALVFAVLLKIVSGGLEERLGMAVDTKVVVGAVVAGMVGLFVAVWAWTVPAMTRAVAVCTALVYLAIYTSFLGQLDPNKSPRAFCQASMALRKPGEPLGYFGVFLEAYPLFTGEKLLAGEKLEEFAPHLDRHPSVLTFMQKEFYKDLVAGNRVAAEILLARRLGDKNMLLTRVTRVGPPTASK